MSTEREVVAGLLGKLHSYLSSTAPDSSSLSFSEETPYQHERFGPVTAGLRLDTDEGDLTAEGEPKVRVTLMAKIGKSRSWVWISSGNLPQITNDVKGFCGDIELIQETLADLIRGIKEMDYIRP